MRNIEDLEHFVLGEGETLILRMTRPINNDQLAYLRNLVNTALPGRPVMILPSDIEVCAGVLEIMGGPQLDPEDAATFDEIEAQRRAEIEQAYEDGRMVYCKDVNNAYGWFYVHKEANPITGWAWKLYDYRLTKPKPGE